MLKKSPVSPPFRRKRHVAVLADQPLNGLRAALESGSGKRQNLQAGVTVEDEKQVMVLRLMGCRIPIRFIPPQDKYKMTIVLSIRFDSKQLRIWGRRPCRPSSPGFRRLSFSGPENSAPKPPRSEKVDFYEPVKNGSGSLNCNSLIPRGALPSSQRYRTGGGFGTPGSSWDDGGGKTSALRLNN